MQGKRTGEIVYTYAEVLDLLRPKLAAEMGIGTDKLEASWDGRRRRLTVTAEVEWASPKGVEPPTKADGQFMTITVNGDDTSFPVPDPAAQDFEHTVKINRGDHLEDALGAMAEKPPLPQPGDTVRLHLTDGTHIDVEVESSYSRSFHVTVEGDVGYGGDYDDAVDLPSNGYYFDDDGDPEHPEAILDRVQAVSWGMVGW
jgi:hypothetical protein